jgi:hypothetical protein
VDEKIQTLLPLAAQRAAGTCHPVGINFQIESLGRMYAAAIHLTVSIMRSRRIPPHLKPEIIRPFRARTTVRDFSEAFSYFGWAVRCLLIRGFRGRFAASFWGGKKLGREAGYDQLGSGVCQPSPSSRRLGHILGGSRR